MTFILQLWLHCPVLLKDLKQQGFRVVQVVPSSVDQF